jgi:hypothetical protein
VATESDEYWAVNPIPDYDDLGPEEQRIQAAVEAAREPLATAEQLRKALADGAGG